jgi:hypothetical protein
MCACNAKIVLVFLEIFNLLFIHVLTWAYYISAILQTFSSGYFVKGAKVVIDTTMID